MAHKTKQDRQREATERWNEKIKKRIAILLNKSSIINRIFQNNRMMVENNKNKKYIILTNMTNDDTFYTTNDPNNLFPDFTTDGKLVYIIKNYANSVSEAENKIWGFIS